MPVKPTVFPVLVGIPVLALAASAGRAQPCQSGWRPNFPTNDLFGAVYSWAQFDDGSGPAVYAGGNFALVGGAPTVNLARWTPGGWALVGASGISGDVNALATFDDGSGPALYAGGLFTSASGTTANNVVKWNGTTWSSLAQGISGRVLALAVFSNYELIFYQLSRLVSVGVQNGDIEEHFFGTESNGFVLTGLLARSRPPPALGMRGAYHQKQDHKGTADSSERFFRLWCKRHLDPV